MLKFHDGRFKVMFVGDPHERTKENDKGADDKHADYLALQYAAIESEKPDLVILMGDNSTGDNEKEFRDTLLRITKPYADTNTPFSFVLGNHDLECAVDSMRRQYEIYRTLPGCILPDENEINEFGDYTVPIYGKDEKEPAFVIRHFYSGNHADKIYGSHYAFVGEKQLDDYKTDAEKLNKKYGRVIPAIAVQHIPVPEVYRLCEEKGPSVMLFDGVTGTDGKKGRFFNLNRKTGVEGYMGEAPCTPDHNGGEFEAWKQTGDVFAAFFGHDHMNDFVGMVDGIILGQCKTASFYAYGDGLMQGVRIIELNENNIKCIKTRMVRYRELIGSNCKSLHGSIKILRDRTSVKLETGAKAAGVAAVLSSPVILAKIIKYSMKKRRG